MKISFIIALSAALGFFGYIAFKRDIQLTNMENRYQLSIREIEILRDENAEYRMSLMTMPKYEDGYRMALLKKEVGTYGEGFADAKNLFDNSNNYAVGYHAAIEQFGLLRQSASQDVKQEEEVK